MWLTGDDDPLTITISQGNDLRALFPGYYKPSKSQRTDAYRQGLVSLDANALLDLYRFTPKAREEFLHILDKIQTRLFIPHQVALEFHRNRMRVAYERFTKAGSDEKEHVDKHLTAVQDRLREFANRYQIEDTERDRLCQLIDNARAELVASMTRAVAYDLDRDDIRKGADPILQRTERLFRGRIGPPFEAQELQQVLREAERRLKDKIPPGYKDADKRDHFEACGDYIAWSQLLLEVARHDRPMLLVSNEQKEDWVLRGPSGEVLGPRPELVLEMKSEAGSELHTVTVAGLLKEAPVFLGISVSDSTIREAEALPHGPPIHASVSIASRAKRKMRAISRNERELLTRALDDFCHEIASGNSWQSLPNVKLLTNDTCVLQWSPDGRAILRISTEGAAGTQYVDLLIQDISANVDIVPPRDRK